MALGLVSPWYVKSSEIIEGELQIVIDFEKGAKFDGLSVHDTVERSWRHLNFWQYPTYLKARVPRVTRKDGKVEQVEVPWARPGSGFTALFEALALTMARSMPVSEVGKSLKVDDMALWRLLEFAVNSSRDNCDFSGVVRVGVDETSCKKRHDYISVFVDLDRNRVLFATRGKASDSIKSFKKDFIEHGGDPEEVLAFSCDMSKAFLSGVAEHFPKASIVLDRFHLVKMLSEAVDTTRKSEAKNTLLGYKSKFLWLKNPSNLSQEQLQWLDKLKCANAFVKTAEAYRLRLSFQSMFQMPTLVARTFFEDWLEQAINSGVRAIEDVAQTFFQMRDKILSWFDQRVSNGVLEGFNSVLQSAKNRARGYGNPNHMILISYLLHAKLDLTPQGLKAIPRRRLSTIVTH